MAKKDEEKKSETVKTEFIKNDKSKKIFSNTPKTDSFTNNDKHTNNFLIAIVGLIFIVIIAIAVLISIFKTDIFKLDTDNNKVKLQYTETTKNNKSEGVYITDVSDIVENVMPSIVSITSKTLVSSGKFGPSFYSQEQYSEGAGSGIIVSQDDSTLYILTNNHVIEGAQDLSVQFINGKSYDATVKGTSERRDVAVITVQIDSKDKETLEAIKIATMGDSSKLKVGNGIIAIGNALGYGQSVTTGVVSALDREVTIDSFTSKMIQIDAAINGGNSGGALLNINGEVVGINSAKYSSSGTSTSASVEGMGFAIPISDVSELITSLMNGENDKGGASIGVEGYIINDNYSQTYNMPTGFYIARIVSDSGADKSDLEIGNIISKIEGKEVKQLSDLQNVLYEKKSGDKVKLTVKYISGREYKEKEIKVTLS